MINWLLEQLLVKKKSNLLDLLIVVALTSCISSVIYSLCVLFCFLAKMKMYVWHAGFCKISPEVSGSSETESFMALSYLNKYSRGFYRANFRASQKTDWRAKNGQNPKKEPRYDGLKYKTPCFLHFPITQQFCETFPASYALTFKTSRTQIITQAFG